MFCCSLQNISCLIGKKAPKCSKFARGTSDSSYATGCDIHRVYNKKTKLGRRENDNPTLPTRVISLEDIPFAVPELFLICFSVTIFGRDVGTVPDVSTSRTTNGCGRFFF